MNCLRENTDNSSEGDWWLEQYADVPVEKINEEILQYKQYLDNLYERQKTEFDAYFLFWFDTEVTAINHDISCLEWVKQQKLNCAKRDKQT